METIKRYDNYPFGIVILSNVVSLGIYVLGFLIIFRVGLVLSILYVLFILSLEYRLLRYHCTNCFYWGRICGFGKGRLSSWFFKIGDSSQFCMKDFTWKDMIPDLLVSLIPFVIGISILIVKFDIMLLSALLMLVVLTTTGNGFIRGTLTCRYCKQGELGCPADLLFNKGNKK
jgi:hypothetical protein